MGTLTAASIINKAVLQLNDLGSTRWTRAELLAWLSDAQRVLVLAAPAVSSATANVTTIPGVKQTIPTDGWVLLRANRNMGASGTESGRVLQLVTEEDISQNNPTWASDTATSTATVYAYTPLLKETFWVYPPSDSTGNKIEVHYSLTPVELVSEDSVITVLDIYEPSLLDYTLYRACSKDAEYAAGVALAGSYLSSFNMQVGIIKSQGV